MGQLPVTCGLFFSLGHSTIVIVVNVAIAISTNVYDHIEGIGKVGGIVGSAVSASFLFIVGLANSIILYRILHKRRKIQKLKDKGTVQGAKGDEEAVDDGDDGSNHNTLMMKFIGPIVTFVDRPWKMYPVGVLFGFGFDTASSIALLAVSAIAKRGPNGEQITPADIVVLPLLFTVGMTLIDSLDSIIMLYSYAEFPLRSFALFEQHTAPSNPCLPRTALPQQANVDTVLRVFPDNLVHTGPVVDSEHDKEDIVTVITEGNNTNAPQHRTMRAKQTTMSNLSIILTIMSILVAFSISLITTMGLIGERCTSCKRAADEPDGGGLAGRWWRAWAKANDNSGYIGAAIVGSFILVVSSWYGLRFIHKKWKARRPES